MPSARCKIRISYVSLQRKVMEAEKKAGAELTATKIHASPDHLSCPISMCLLTDPMVSALFVCRHVCSVKRRVGPLSDCPFLGFIRFRVSKVAADNNTYQREHIEDWFHICDAGITTCPA